MMHRVIRVCIASAKQLQMAQFRLVFKEPKMHGASMAVARLVGKWLTAWNA
jgi:hypothetical protein